MSLIKFNNGVNKGCCCGSGSGSGAQVIIPTCGCSCIPKTIILNINSSSYLSASNTCGSSNCSAWVGSWVLDWTGGCLCYSLSVGLPCGCVSLTYCNADQELYINYSDGFIGLGFSGALCNFGTVAWSGVAGGGNFTIDGCGNPFTQMYFFDNAKINLHSGSC